MLEDLIGTKTGQYWEKKYGFLLHPDKVFPFENAQLHRAKSGWYVDYLIFSVKENKLKRRKKIISGKSKSEKLETAKNIIFEINNLLAKGAHVDPVKELRKSKAFPLVVALDLFMQEKRLTLKKSSVATYEQYVRYFLAFLEHSALTTINISDFNNEHAADLRTYCLHTAKMGNKKYNTYKGFISGFLIYCKPIYGLASNAIEDTLKNLPTKTSKHLAYSKKQIIEYREACEALGMPELWFFVRILYYTFCRPHEELRQMRIGDIMDDHIMVYAGTSKTNHRSVMIPTALEKVFEEWGIRDYPPHFYLFSHGYKPGATMVSKNFFYEKHRKVTLKMEIDLVGYDIYGWKHTGVIALYKETKDIMLIKEQCGHSDISQTVQYLRDLGAFHYSMEINRFPEI